MPRVNAWDSDRTIVPRDLVIDWDRDCAPEVRAAIEPILRRCADVVPSWCRALRVRLTTSEKASLSITAREQQRDALFYVHAEWLMYDELERERIVLHELAHAITQPLAGFAKGLIGDLTEEDSDLRRRCERQFQDANEGVVEDLAWALQSRLRRSAKA